ncbi:hypothetical protein RFL36_10255 [Streptococcus suis]
MVKNISKRLERLQELASQKKEVSVEDNVIKLTNLSHFVVG